MNLKPYTFDLANKALDSFFAKLLEKESDFALQDIDNEFATGKLGFNNNNQICYTDFLGERRPVWLFMYKPNYAVFGRRQAYRRSRSHRISESAHCRGRG